MPVFDMRCPECGQVYEDEWGTSEGLKVVPCEACGHEHREVIIHAVGMVWGDSMHDPGTIRQFEMSWTDVEGNTHTKDVRDRLTGEKGKMTTPWDGKKVSPKEVERLAADVGKPWET